MGVSNSFRKVAYIQIVLGLLAYAVAEQNPAMVLAAGTLGTLSWYIVEGPGGRPLPRWVIYLAVIGSTGWLLYSQLPPPSQQLIVGLGRYILSMQLCMLYSGKTNREWAMIMVLSLMEMICALIISSEVIFGVLLVAYLIATLVAVMIYQLKVGHEEVAASHEAQAPTGQRPVPPPAISSRGYKRHFNTTAAFCGVMTLAVSAVLFIFMPRGQGTGMFGDWNTNTRRAQSGYSDKVELGGGTRIVASRMPMMNVRVLLNGLPAGPSEAPLTLLRGMAMDSYNPRVRQWSRSPAAIRTDQALGEKEPTVPLLLPQAARPAPQKIVQQITLRTQTKGSLFAVYPPTSVTAGDVKGVFFNPHDQVVTTRQTVPEGTQYSVESLIEPANLAAAYLKRWPATANLNIDWKTYARGPVLQDPRIKAQADAIMAARGLDRDPNAESTPKDHAIAQPLMEYLQSKDFYYTLDLPEIPPAAEPIATFLFDTKRAHCEYFAAAMCAMARSVGLRSRVINGARVVEYNSVGGYYVIRQKNAHAWTEVWQDGAGWKTFDPSPQAALVALQKPTGGLFAIFRDLYEYAEYKWIDKVVTYDDSQRRNIMVSVDHSLASITALLTKIKDAINKFIESFTRRWAYGTFGYVLLGLIALVVFATIVTSMVLLIRRRRIIKQLQLDQVSRKLQRQMAKHLQFYLEMLRVLEKAGFVKPLWQTPASFAAQLELQNAVRFAPVVPLTEVFYEIRFGGRPLDADRARNIQTLLVTLRETV